MNPELGGPTVSYKSGERAKIERSGVRIIANIGDQESDLEGGHADRGFKYPNPFYFIGAE
jgi:acid phosphatase